VYDELALTANQVFVFTMTVTNSSIVGGFGPDLKVTVTWNDLPYPASQAGAKTLINDIDLLVVTPDDVGYVGNRVVDGDHLNPVEQVYINQTVLGEYRIFVGAAVLSSASQDIAVVVTYPRGHSIAGPDIVPADFSLNYTDPAPVPGTSPAGAVPISPRNDDFTEYVVPLNVLIPEWNSSKIYINLGAISAPGELQLVTLDAVSDSPTCNLDIVYASKVLVTAPSGLRAQVGGGTPLYKDNLYVTNAWATKSNPGTKGCHFLSYYPHFADESEYAIL